MKKFTIFLLLLSLVVIFGCGSKENVKEDEMQEVDIVSTDIDVKVCDEYFELVQCVIDKTTNQNRTKKMKNELKLELKAKQEERKKMDKDELAKTCSGMLDVIYTSATDLDDLGCLN